MHGLLVLQQASSCSPHLTLTRLSPAKSSARQQPRQCVVRSANGDHGSSSSGAGGLEHSKPNASSHLQKLATLVTRHQARHGNPIAEGFEQSFSRLCRTSAAVAAIALLSLGNPIIPTETTSLTSAVTSPLSIGRASAAYDRPMEDYDREKLLEQNKRMQAMNQVPDNFPGFVRQGFEVTVIKGDEYQVAPSGLIYWDIIPGTGKQPQDGQQVEFNYIGYNENGRRVDSTYNSGQPARTRVGIKGMIPGFEEGIRGMKEGGLRRIIIPPELGPPTGPSTFFSAKQYEVFDIELLNVKDCVRRQVVFYSDVVCT